MVRFLFVPMLFVVMTICGCGNPTIHPIEGKITLGGKSYERLIVYFRPVEGEINEFNLGVGETDKDGKLTLRSTAGYGLRTGDYKVTFTYKVAKKAGNKTITPGLDEKPDDDRSIQFQELVPSPYDDGTSTETTPIRYTVKSGTNQFDYDIPTTAKR